MAFFSTYYICARWIDRYLRWSDFLGVLILITGCVLATTAYPANEIRSIFVGITFLVAYAWRAVAVVSQRRARDAVQASVFWSLCYRIDTEVVQSKYGARITLFTRDSFRRKFITARYRYRRGLSDPIREARESRARFKWKEALAGWAWSQPGDLFFAFFPPFANREEFEEYYLKRLKIDAEALRELSDVVGEFRTIIAYGLQDSAGRFLGVVSIDFTELVTTKGGVGVPPGFMESYLDDSEIVEFDESQIRNILRSMQSMLEAFAKV